jgi:myo-inositol-1(or 4)-monophosphatase
LNFPPIKGGGLPTSSLVTFPGAYQRLEAIRDPIGAVRIVGSSANSCAYVARGRLTGYYEESGLEKGAKAYAVRDSTGKTVARWSLGS